MLIHARHVAGDPDALQEGETHALHVGGTGPAKREGHSDCLALGVKTGPGWWDGLEVAPGPTPASVRGKHLQSSELVCARESFPVLRSHRATNSKDSGHGHNQRLRSPQTPTFCPNTDLSPPFQAQHPSSRTTACAGDLKQCPSVSLGG